MLYDFKSQGDGLHQFREEPSKHSSYLKNV